ncbi:MAG: hypothetical protein AB7O97_20650 [Planctomycetota bacterium]
MDVTLSHLHPSPLPRPGRGQSARFRLGRMELILEPVRGGWSLLCNDGREARTWSLGLTDDGELWLHCRVPRWPLRVALRDTLVLVPGARVRGYVQVPLVPTVRWRTRAQGEHTIAELLPPVLSAEWDQAQGTVTQRCNAPLLQRVPLADSEPRAVIPLTVRNESPRMQSPETLPVSLRDRELAPCRGHLVAAPRRLCIDGEGRIATALRPGRAEHPA